MAPLAKRLIQAGQVEAAVDGAGLPAGGASVPMAGAAPPMPRDPTLLLLLNSGGDSRIALDPATGRTPYGTPGGPATEEIWLSSSTAAAVSPRGFAAAGRALDAVFRLDGSLAPEAWLDGLRGRIKTLFGIPGAEVVLTASGTETELIALTLARAALERPITNIVLAPAETGSGVMKAAAGQHFLATTNSGLSVTAGTLLDGFDTADIRVAGIEVRDGDGRPLPTAAIEAAASTASEAALRAGRDVLLHQLETSKTGLAGLSREGARRLVREAGGRMLVVVDACQLRCEPDTIKADLAAGFMVMITGSKFAGGPPYCGALLVPPSLVELIGDGAGAQATPGLAAYSAVMEWPPRLRGALTAALTERVNFGLGLRWEAALAEIEAYFALSAAIRTGIASAFARTVELAISDRAFLERFDANEAHRCPTIIPVVGRGAHGHASAALATHRALRAARRPCHLGQPVQIGMRAPMRFCLSMAHVVDVAQRMRDGASFERAMAPLETDVVTVLDQWEAIAHGS